MTSLLCIILIILLSYLLINNFFSYKEGWGRIKKWNPFKAIFSAGKKMLRGMSSIPGKISGVGRQIGGLGRKISRGFTDNVAKTASALNEIKKLPQMGEELGDMIENAATDAANEVKGFGQQAIGSVGNFVTEDLGGVVDKIGASFIQLGEMFSQFFTWIFQQIKDVFFMIAGVFEDFFNTIKDGFMKFFEMIGDLFMDIVDFFYDIFEAIVHLPNCIPYYASDTTKAIALTILPKWIKDIIRWCFSWIINPLIYFWSRVLELFGFNFKYFDKNKDKCYPDFMKAIASVMMIGINFIMDIFNMIFSLF